MNKLNGGYIMIDGSSSTLQADLKIAYETGRPVLYYDENGKSEFVKIYKFSNTKYGILSLEQKGYNLSGKDANEDNFYFAVSSNIINLDEIGYDLIVSSGITLVIEPSDETSYGGEDLNAFGGSISGEGGILYCQPTSGTDVSYRVLDFLDATDVVIE